MKTNDEIEEILDKQFAERIRRIMRRKNINVEELHFLTDIPWQRFQSIIHGRPETSITQIELQLIADALGEDYDSLARYLIEVEQ